jgi:hypothetical protein
MTRVVGISFSFQIATATLRSMKRDIEWTEKLDDGTKRTVRVTFYQGKIRWQFMRSDEGLWDYDTPPSPADWSALETKVDQLYHRRRVSYEDLELVRATRKNSC